MRILVLSNLYPPAAVGGYERMCHDVVERWRARGHDITVLTTTFGGAGQPVEPAVHRRLSLYWNGEEIVCPPLLQQIRLERANQRALARALRRARPDVVSVWGMGGLSLGLLAAISDRGLPITFVVGDDWLVYGRWADCWTRRLDSDSPHVRRLTRLLRLPGAPPALGAAGAFYFVSEFTRRRAEEVVAMEMPRVAVVPAGIDHTDVPPAAPQELPWRWRLLCVDSPAEIAAALRRLAADDGLRRRLVLAGIDTAAQFSVERQAAALEEAHVAVARRVPR